MMTPAAQLAIYEDIIDQRNLEIGELKQKLVIIGRMLGHGYGRPLEQRVADLIQENDLLTAGLEGARESLKPYLMIEKEWQEAKRQLATLKEDQRVSSEAYNFLHTEYQRALNVVAILAGDLRHATLGMCTQQEEKDLALLDDLMWLPPPTTGPSSLPSDPAGNLPDPPDPT